MAGKQPPAAQEQRTEIKLDTSGRIKSNIYVYNTYARVYMRVLVTHDLINIFLGYLLYFFYIILFHSRCRSFTPINSVAISFNSPAA